MMFHDCLILLTVIIILDLFITVALLTYIIKGDHKDAR